MSKHGQSRQLWTTIRQSKRPICSRLTPREHPDKIRRNAEEITWARYRMQKAEGQEVCPGAVHVSRVSNARIQFPFSIFQRISMKCEVSLRLSVLTNPAASTYRWLLVRFDTSMGLWAGKAETEDGFPMYPLVEGFLYGITRRSFEVWTQYAGCSCRRQPRGKTEDRTIYAGLRG